jgi:putative colanic acid biosynthesis UDP-glucose lipid carrier transferase
MIANRKGINLFRILSDLILLNIVFATTEYSEIKKIFIDVRLFILLIGSNLLWVFSGKVFGLYDDYRSRNYSYEIINVIKCVIVQFFYIVSVIFLFKINMFNRSFVIIFIAGTLIMIGSKGYFLRRLLSFLRKKGKNIRNIVIIGAGEVGLKFKRFIEVNKVFGYKCVGMLDDNPQPKLQSEYLGKIDDLEEIIKHINIDDVVITLPNYAFEKIENIVKVSNKNALRTRIIPDYFKFLSPKYQLSSFGNFPIISIRNEILAELHWRFLKRSFDIIFSLFAIVFLFILIFPIIYIVQKITSPGPILFMQDRIGRKGKIFRCFKLRSMKCESVKENISFKATEKDDPRITKFGKFLRKTNLDEIPQFINVLLGDMSIVGPRPHAINFEKKYSEYFEEIKLRSMVKPGITGWAQVHGLRGDVPDEEENKKRTRKRIEFDLWYIENWTFWLDIQIILLTVWRMIKGDPNAY